MKLSPQGILSIRSSENSVGVRSKYLLIRDFRQRINKRGAPYGWPISVYTTPEVLWGYDHISSAYSAEPAESKMLIYEQVRKNFSEATQEELDAVLGWTR